MEKGKDLYKTIPKEYKGLKAYLTNAKQARDRAITMGIDDMRAELAKKSGKNIEEIDVKDVTNPDIWSDTKQKIRDRMTGFIDHHYKTKTKELKPWNYETLIDATSNLNENYLDESMQQLKRAGKDFTASELGGDTTRFIEQLREKLAPSVFRNIKPSDHIPLGKQIGLEEYFTNLDWLKNPQYKSQIGNLVVDHEESKTINPKAFHGTVMEEYLKKEHKPEKTDLQKKYNLPKTGTHG